MEPTEARDALPTHGADELVRLVRERAPILVLTGAGCSTESGIPDYRGPETRRRARNPVRWSTYAADPIARARYWARSLVGWPRMAGAVPNAAHHAIAAIERAGVARGLITQNVDGLHHAAGSRRVVELHGSLAEVACMACGTTEPRAEVQHRLLAMNPRFVATEPGVESAPDGDAELDGERLAGFRVADCRLCGGALKPDVVFFGENVPRHRVEAAFAMLGEARALLVVGSSLTVYSGLRFVRRATADGKPVAIVNLGPTRGDDAACVRVDARAGEVMPALVAALAIGA